jgi:predicted Fe-S protein YdhL (DUF1289 family)
MSSPAVPAKSPSASDRDSAGGSALGVIATPCIRVCAVDGESGLCLGCHRTLREIAGWARLSDGERQSIMAGLAARRGRIDPRKLGLAG